LPLLVGQQEVHPVCKKLGVGLLVALHMLIAPDVTTTSIFLSSDEIQYGDILLPANAGSHGKMAIKIHRETQLS